MTYQPGDILLEKYRVAEGGPLGQGTFGDVYLVTHINLRVPRAVKILRRDSPGMGSSLYQDAQQRFLLEGQLGARLRNLHLLQVYDFIIQDDLLLLEMEYAAGGNLSERILKLKETKTPFPLEEALQIAADVATGLGALHEMDIVHRDLKPANILFDDHGQARVADLGLAQIPGGPSQRSQLSEPMPHPGTPAYMSPEQHDSLQYLTSASDIYSLGLVLFEMLTGRIYINQPPGTRASSRRKDLPAALDDLLARMLSESNKERPWDGETTADLLNGMLAALKSGGEPFHLGKEAELSALADDAEKARLAKAAEGQRKKVEEQARKEAERLAQVEAAEKARIAGEQARQEAERNLHELIIELAPGVSMEFVRVPAGEFLMGIDKLEDKKASEAEAFQHKVMLDDYLIGKTPVTNRQYQAFVQAAGYRKPDHWENGEISNGKLDHPVVSISWSDASAFCAWASKVSGFNVRLPSEAEWEKAARGTDGRIYPWGNQTPDARYCNFNSIFENTTPVGKFSPIGDSAYGCVDMAGNVWEWQADYYDHKYYQNSPAKNPTGPANGTDRVLRGGSWLNTGNSMRVSNRGKVTPENRSNYYGFRCAR